jgi:hypothetical protein
MPKPTFLQPDRLEAHWLKAALTLCSRVCRPVAKVRDARSDQQTSSERHLFDAALGDARESWTVLGAVSLAQRCSPPRSHTGTTSGIFFSSVSCFTGLTPVSCDLNLGSTDNCTPRQFNDTLTTSRPDRLGVIRRASTAASAFRSIFHRAIRAMKCRHLQGRESSCLTSGPGSAVSG